MDPVSYEFDATVAAESEGKRLDQWLTAELDGCSRSVVQELISRGDFYVGSKPAKPSLVLKEGDHVRGSLAALDVLSEQPWTPGYLDLDVLYEDEAVLVVNKPAGLVTHPGRGTRQTTLIEGVMHYLAEREDSVTRHGLIHRLDKDTSGALVIAKDARTYQHLSDQLKKRDMFREYVALLDGCLDQSPYSCESYLSRSQKDRTRFEAVRVDELEARYPQGVPRKYRYAQTEFATKASFAYRFDLCTVKLSTGRTHQIRAHALWLAKPVLGDQIYRKQGSSRKKSHPDDCSYRRLFRELAQEVRPLARQMLHARSVGFLHPNGQYVKVSAPLPQDFREVLSSLADHLTG